MRPPAPPPRVPALRAGCAAVALAGLLGACAQMKPAPLPESKGHLNAQSEAAGPAAEIPDVVPQTSWLPPPTPAPDGERYTVVVSEVPVRELLFALARDAEMNVDIKGEIDDKVTLNAIDQTLPQILDRLAHQVSLRYEIDGNHILVVPDDPYFRTYDVGYVNLARDTDTTVNIATQVATTGEGGADQAGGRGGAGGQHAQGTNSSSTRVNSRASNRFWETLTQNVLSIIGEAQTAGGNGERLQSDRLIVNPEAGVLTVKATSHEHELIQAFIDRVLTNARRQVMIEATIVEVSLNDQYQAGVDWRILLDEDKAGFGVNQQLLGQITDGVIDNAVSSFVFGYTDPNANGKLIEATVRLLREFGDTKVLSSPRLMVLNNQTALLKVVEELVYFTVDVTNTDSTLNAQGRTFVETEVHSVPVGLVMAVTPQISANQEVTLTVRPTISQKIGDAVDPGPKLVTQLNGGDAGDITNLVPVIRTREMESVLKLVNGQVGVLGGLMQDERKSGNREVPGLARLPLLGDLFFNADEVNNRKTELVIFLRPVVIEAPSLERDLKDYQQFLGQSATAAPASALP
ncbi:MAG TPA: secretin N-terminal domain-containing protein [Gammaproteobacteria bacterium]|nr:secretin N-terminal domain-containing protein [Gammaproteobacteria bacterium]